MIVMIGGSANTGKTTLAQWLHDRFKFPVVKLDDTAKEYRRQSNDEWLAPKSHDTPGWLGRVILEVVDRGELHQFFDFIRDCTPDPAIMEGQFVGRHIWKGYVMAAWAREIESRLKPIPLIRLYTGPGFQIFHDDSTNPLNKEDILQLIRGLSNAG